MLADDGTLALDDPVSQYLPDFNEPAQGQRTSASYLMQAVLRLVKKRYAASPPSHPTPRGLTPPNGVRR
jgi:CubicO group peptidase (beta-lactamase class C family)